MPRKVKYGCYLTWDLFHMVFRLELSMTEEEKRWAERGSDFWALQRLEINKLTENKKGTSIKDLTLERFCHCIVGLKLGNLGVIQTEVEEGILLRHLRCTLTLTVSPTKCTSIPQPFCLCFFIILLIYLKPIQKVNVPFVVMHYRDLWFCWICCCWMAFACQFDRGVQDLGWKIAFCLFVKIQTPWISWHEK